jgi:5'(3')-deoxyribonucleotidase
MQNLILEENISDNYKVRTEENVNNSDLTLAIAIDFDSFGEKITKELTLKADKKYIAVSPDGDPIKKATKIVAKMNDLNLPQKFILNIAGNGLSTMKGQILQNEADEFTYILLKTISQNPKLNSKIGSVRTGGQSGFDEAGAKAAIKLGFTTVVHMPKGFKMRNQDGKDVTMSYEHAKLRFDVIKPKTVYIDMDGVICDYKKTYLRYKAKHPEIVYPQSQYGFFLELEPLPGAIEAFLKLSALHDVWILTAPSIQNPMSYSEKNYWVRKYLGEECVKKLIMCPNKSLLKGDYLIDDNEWTNWQGDFEGNLVLIGSEEYPNLASTVEFFDSI